MQAVFWLVNAARRAQRNVSPGENNHFKSHARSSWTAESGGAPAAEPGQRWAAGVCGSCVAECDLRTAEGLKAARAAYVARRPIILRHASEVIAPDVCAELGDVTRLSALLKGLDVTVLRADRAAKGRFTYYHDVSKRDAERGDARHRKMMAPPQVNERVLMSWEQFYRALRAHQQSDTYYYMQLAIAARQGGISSDPTAGVSTRVSPRILASLQAAMRAGPLHRLTRDLGPWTVSNLYCGPANTLAPCHWDALDNTFLQLHGRKDVLMFAPETAGLRPFPHDHPFGSRAQVDLERLDEQSRAELAGRGALARLAPGDGLFIPSMWWHHIQSSAANELSISLNFWFDPSRELHAALQSAAGLPHPPTPSLHQQLAREVEALVAATTPTMSQRAAFFSSVASVLAGDLAASPGELGADSVAKRNFVLQMLVSIFGQEGARRFCAAYLDPRRWSGLQRVCFLDQR